MSDKILMEKLLKEAVLTETEIEELTEKLNIKKERLEEITTAIWIVVDRRFKNETSDEKEPI